MAERDLYLGKKLSLLSKLKGMTQKDISILCQISRISVNRFFQSRSEIRAGDFVRLLSTLGIDLHAIIDRHLQGAAHQSAMPNEDVYSDLMTVFTKLDPQVKKTLIEQISWWGKSTADPLTTKAVHRIREHFSDDRNPNEMRGHGETNF